jgi:hypothetical protein
MHSFIHHMHPYMSLPPSLHPSHPPSLLVSGIAVCVCVCVEWSGLVRELYVLVREVDGEVRTCQCFFREVDACMPTC